MRGKYNAHVSPSSVITAEMGEYGKEFTLLKQGKTSILKDTKSEKHSAVPVKEGH